jgi:hypothetical protein
VTVALGAILDEHFTGVRNRCASEDVALARHRHEDVVRTLHDPTAVSFAIWVPPVFLSALPVATEWIEIEVYAVESVSTANARRKIGSSRALGPRSMATCDNARRTSRSPKPKPRSARNACPWISATTEDTAPP